MIVAGLLLLAQSPNYFDRFDPPPGYVLDKPPVEKLGPGPHTLIIYSAKGVTRFDYKTGPACQKARDAVRQQLKPAPDPRVIYSNPGITAVCVPR